MSMSASLRLATSLWLVSSSALACFGCGGHTNIYQYYYDEPADAGPSSAGLSGASANGDAGQPVGGSAAGASAGGPSAGEANAGGTAGGSGSGSGAAGTNSTGGAAGTNGAGGAAGIGGSGGTAGASGAGGQPSCVSAADCPTPPSLCVAVNCEQGACATANVSQGSVFLPDSPPDCHATTCDGFGDETHVVYQNNAPKSDNPCLIGTCDSLGTASTEPAPAGTPCRAAGGGILCDGAGICAECLHTADCSNGLSCSATERCVSAPCTDTDCGGACPPCADGKQCLVDADCAGYACDAVTLTCQSDQCRDHQQDGNETDADCGGGVCVPCALGKACKLSSDCATLACDGISFVCVSNTCEDDRQDGNETDVDCGGFCKLCGVGQKCATNFDCISGHFCNSETPRVCQ